MAEVDGVRFIAIISVLIFHVYFAATHVSEAKLVASPFDFLFLPISNGHRGVELFFVLSGFILGLPFAAHYLVGSPAVSIGRFYLRRLTRLEPPYVIALLLFYVAAFVLNNEDAQQVNFISSLLLRLGYVHNLTQGIRASLNGVTWTLEIEVQFYLLMPILAQVFRLGKVARRVLLVVCICGSPWLARITPASHVTILGYAEFFLAGLLLSDLYCTQTGGRWKSSRSIDLLGVVCLVLVMLAPDTPFFLQMLPWLLAAIVVAAFCGNWFSEVMRQPVITVLGGMCYSLYLLHYPVFSFLANKVVINGMPLPLACLRVAVVGLPCALGAGIAFYLLIERPCMDPNWPQAALRCLTRQLKVKGADHAAKPTKPAAPRS